MAAKNWRKSWRTLSPNPLRGQPTQRNQGTSPRENCCWVRTSHSWRGTGRGQERDSPTLSGAARRPGKYLCPLSKAHQNARAANGTGGEDGPKLAAVGPDLHSRHLLSDRRALSPAVLRFSGRGAGSSSPGGAGGMAVALIPGDSTTNSEESVNFATRKLLAVQGDRRDGLISPRRRHHAGTARALPPRARRSTAPAGGQGSSC
jgi:hypothetical protein